MSGINHPTDKAESRSLIQLNKIGFKEESFVRPRENFNCTVQEFEDLAFHPEMTFSAYKMLLKIKHRTIDWRETHMRTTRNEFFEKLGIKKTQGLRDLKILTNHGWLVERKDDKDFYLYAINPKPFNGLIVLKDIHNLHLVNAKHKLSTRKAKLSTSGHKMLPIWSQNVTDWVTKCDLEEDLNSWNQKGFFALHYLLTHYLLSHQVRGSFDTVFEIIGNIKKGWEYSLIELVMFMHQRPNSIQGILEELKRAHRDKFFLRGDGNPGSHIYSGNIISVVLKSWDSIKHHYANIMWNSSNDPDCLKRRQEVYDLIVSFPLESNVQPLRKKA